MLMSLIWERHQSHKEMPPYPQEDGRSKGQRHTCWRDAGKGALC